MKIAAKTALIVLAIDQISKIAVIYGLRLQEGFTTAVFPPFLNFQMAWNKGVNVGLLANDVALMRWILIAVALGIAAWVWRWVGHEGHGTPSKIAAGLLIGGALGNVIDRVIHGAVADFLNMSCCGMHNPFSFNLADVAVFLGAVGLVLLTGRQNTRDGPGSMR